MNTFSTRIYNKCVILTNVEELNHFPKMHKIVCVVNPSLDVLHIALIYLTFTSDIEGGFNFQVLGGRECVIMDLFCLFGQLSRALLIDPAFTQNNTITVLFLVIPTRGL